MLRSELTYGKVCSARCSHSPWLRVARDTSKTRPIALRTKENRLIDAPLGKVRANARRMRLRPVPIVFAVVSLISPIAAGADDAGEGSLDGGAIADGSSGDLGTPDRGGPPANAASASDAAGGPTYVWACDSALCETTTGSQCGVAHGVPGRAPSDAGLVIAAAGAAALSGARRVRRRASRPFPPRIWARTPHQP
jgi:hypothetical protein